MKHFLQYKVLRFLQETGGAVAFEYVLIIGGVSVVMVGSIGLAPSLFSGLITGVCEGMDSVVGGLGTISC